MRKIQKILSVIFLGGILLGGIGTGVALVEYSSLAYAGERLLGEENLVTREMDYTFIPGEEEVTIVDSYWEEEDCMIEADKEVPEGTIRYIITYNEKAVKPGLNFWEDEEAEQELPAEGMEVEEAGEAGAAREPAWEAVEEQQNRKKTFLQLHIRYIDNDFAVIMTCKDEILRELKNKRIFNYDMAYVTELRIKVNPQTISYVHKK
ncbi:MAG: hypothetical protein HFG55_11280 [Lachnospiraceae bacterium]|nr:hypothetical protein [Lachnospiraceae bacterium]